MEYKAQRANKDKDKKENQRLYNEFIKSGTVRNQSWDQRAQYQTKKAVADTVGECNALLSSKWPNGTVVRGITFMGFARTLMAIKSSNEEVFSDILLLVSGLKANSGWDLLTLYIDSILQRLGVSKDDNDDSDDNN